VCYNLSRLSTSERQQANRAHVIADRSLILKYTAGGKLFQK